MHTFAQRPKTIQRTSSKPILSAHAHSAPLERTRAIQPAPLISEVKQNHAGEPASCAPPDFHHIPLYPRRSRLQAKLTVGSPDDVYEREADSISQRVMRMPAPQLQRTCDCGSTCAACRGTHPDSEQTHLQTKPLAAEDREQTPAPAIVEEVLSLPGDPLDTATRSFMESRFGHDFSAVRIHTGHEARQSAEAVQARAYTVGNQVVFGAGQYLPGTSSGQTLLAHELTHVIQQQAAPPATARISGSQGIVATGTAAPAVQRDDKDQKHTAGFGNKPHAVSAAQVKKMEARTREDDKALDILVPFINLKGNAFLDQWLTQMISAKSDTSAQVEDGPEYWIVGLLGNLLWAASCFIPGAGIVAREVQGFDNPAFKAGAAAMFKGGVSQDVARAAGAAIEEAVQPGMSTLGKIMYATMATGGGIAASGLGQRWAVDPSGDPTGKDVIATALNAKRAELGQRLKGNTEMLADDLVHSGFDFKRYEAGRQKYLDGVEQAIWGSLFPSIAQNDLTAIYKSGLDSIGRGLDEFKHQYSDWKKYTQQCALNFTTPMTQYPHDTKDWPESIKSGREQPLQYCQRTLPFRPKLHFI